MLVSYPALFYYDPDEEIPFFVTFPDFMNSTTQGNNISDAIMMAADWLGINVADYWENGRTLPTPTNIQSLSLQSDNPYPEELKYDDTRSFVSMVTTDVSQYLEQNQPVKKTLTIPHWSDKLGKDRYINFSQTLTDAIADLKINHN